MDSTVQMLALETWQWLIIAVCVIVIVIGLVMRNKSQA
jgi:hypothetical protein